MKKIIARDNNTFETLGAFDSLEDFHRTYPSAEITFIETEGLEALADEYKRIFRAELPFAMQNGTHTTIYC